MTKKTNQPKKVFTREDFVKWGSQGFKKMIEKHGTETWRKGQKKGALKRKKYFAELRKQKAETPLDSKGG